MEEIKCEPIIYDDYNGRIRADQDCIGTLTINCGNDALRNGVKIIEPVIVDEIYNNREPRVYSEHCPTIRAERQGLEVIEPRIAAMRGRNPDNPSDRTAGTPTEQRLEIGSEETSNTLTTVQKDNLVVEPNYELSDKMKRYINSTHDKYQVSGSSLVVNRDIACSKTTKEGITRADASDYITPDFPENANVANIDLVPYRIRKLTEKECGRLMGVKGEDCDRIARNQSTSSQYHLYGDAIVTTCLMAIFGQLFRVDYESKINELVEELKQ